MKSPRPDVAQPWYADNAGALGTFARFKSYLNLIKLFDPGQGYCTDRTSKSE